MFIVTKITGPLDLTVLDTTDNIEVKVTWEEMGKQLRTGVHVLGVDLNSGCNYNHKNLELSTSDGVSCIYLVPQGDAPMYSCILYKVGDALPSIFKVERKLDCGLPYPEITNILFNEVVKGKRVTYFIFSVQTREQIVKSNGSFAKYGLDVMDYLVIDGKVQHSKWYNIDDKQQSKAIYYNTDNYINKLRSGKFVFHGKKITL